MARIRTIKPEFPQSESMGRVSRDARLLFVQLWTLCDDAGRARGNSRMLASLLFPYDDDAPSLIDDWLDELDREGCVVLYRADGGTYIQVCNWLNHQKIDHPSKSKIPAPEEGSRVFASPREHSCVDQGSRSGPKDQGVDQGEANASVASLSADDPVAGNSTASNSSKPPQCPTGLLVNLYHKHMPSNPQVKVLNDARKKAIQARWREAAILSCAPFGYQTQEAGLAAWEKFFIVCAESDFLTGKAQAARPGQPPFVADIDFLMSPSGFAKCLENKYHREAA